MKLILAAIAGVILGATLGAFCVALVIAGRDE